MMIDTPQVTQSTAQPAAVLHLTPDLWDIYTTGPEANADPSTWRTELNRPLC